MASRSTRSNKSSCVSDEDSSWSESDDHSNYDDTTTQTGRRRSTKPLSKNAINARENRLKKKVYLAKLESSVRRLKKELDKYADITVTQKDQINQLNVEVKYLRSIIRNSASIDRLVRNVGSTGMSVVNVEQRLSLNNDCVSKPEPQQTLPQTPPHSSCSPLNACSLLDDLEMNDYNKDFNLSMFSFGFPEASAESPLDEHNYTRFPTHSLDFDDDEEDVGVCLHISKKGAALDFCAQCNDRAQSAWHENGLTESTLNRRLPCCSSIESQNVSPLDYQSEFGRSRSLY